MYTVYEPVQLAALMAFLVLDMSFYYLLGKGERISRWDALPTVLFASPQVEGGLRNLAEHWVSGVLWSAENAQRISEVVVSGVESRFKETT